MQELDFFNLYFGNAVYERIAESTNEYAWQHITHRACYADRFGVWPETDAEEIQRLIGLLMYMSLTKLLKYQDCWRVSSLFHSNWARQFIPSRNRFAALMTFLHVTSPSEVQPDDKLKKLRWLNDHLKSKCKSLFQPYQLLSVDKRMVHMKGRSYLRQYMPQKPIKVGCESVCSC